MSEPRHDPVSEPPTEPIRRSSGELAPVSPPTAISSERPLRPSALGRGPQVVLLSMLGLLVLVATSGYVALTTKVVNGALLAVINLTALAATGLLFVLGRNLGRVFLQRQLRFRVKLVRAFIMFSAGPVLLLGVVGSGLATQTLSRWFNPQFESYLRGSKSIVEEFIRSEQRRLTAAMRVIRDDLPIRVLAIPAERLEAIRERHDVDALDLLGPDGRLSQRVVRKDIAERFEGVKPPPDLFAVLRSGQESAFERFQLPRGAALGLAAPLPAGISAGALVLYRYENRPMARSIEEISDAFTDFKNLEFSKGQFQLAFLITFVAIGLALVFAASWFAESLAKEIAAPAQALAEGAAAVARGDLDVQIERRSMDEFGVLVLAFNQMVGELKRNRATIDQAQHSLLAQYQELGEQRAYIERLLEDIPAGVISVDVSGRVATINHRAATLLGISAAQALQQDACAVFGGTPIERLRHWIQQAILHPGEQIVRQLALPGEQGVQHLDVTISSFGDNPDGPDGVIMVLEDLSELLRAQRAAAWQEVARRIAHEIKNPLSPITIAAARARKHLDAQAENATEVCRHALGVILESAREIQLLVDEFSQFARLPEANPEATDLNELIVGMVDSYRGLYPDITFEAKLSPNLPIMNLDPELMRRALRNLLDNAIESQDRRGLITVLTTHDPTLRIARLTVADEGPGVRPEDRDKLFSPYFSTKGEKGTGLGLTIVAKIVSDHQGYIRVRDNQPRGAQFVIELPTGYSAVATWGRG